MDRLSQYVVYVKTYSTERGARERTPVGHAPNGVSCSAKLSAKNKKISGVTDESEL